MLYKYHRKKILILGLGLTGISCINFFLKKGIRPRAMDEAKNPVHLTKIPKNIKCHLGSFKNEWILTANLIILSPGISSFRPIFIKANILGIEIINDLELFFRETSVPIVSITGTNGKSTVATMIEKIAKTAGLKVFLCGNIGIPVLDVLKKKADFYIIEISSFQLEKIKNFTSKIAVILNISPDHINRYPMGFKCYKKTKFSIYKNAEICIINSNIQYPHLCNSHQKWISFGVKQGDYQIHFRGNKTTFYHKREKMFDTSKISLNGKHHYINALVAIIISDIMNISRILAINVLKTFSNLSHRFQLVQKKNGISWINDSKSTNINSTIMALNSLKNNKKIRLLMGGDGKSANFNILKQYFKNMPIKIYCFGKDKHKISKICPKKSISFENLNQAMKSIFNEVKYGDTILLSPGCSSLDQFNNFEERGNLFIKLIKEHT